MGNGKRLIVLSGVAVALAVAYVVVHGLPGTGVDGVVDLAPQAPPPPGNGDDGGGEAADSPEPAAVSPSYRQIASIVRSPEPRHLPELTRAARSPERKVREQAVVGMGRLGKKADPEVLVEKLAEDKAPEVRSAAATALGRIESWEAGPKLIEALRDPDPRVRAQAGVALKRIMGVDFGYRANDPKREEAIRRIEHWWPRFLAKHRDFTGGKG